MSNNNNNKEDIRSIAKDSELEGKITVSNKYDALIEVEEYLKEAVKKYDFDLSYDITATEDLYFKTLNYTTYCGFLIIHPVCVEQGMRQMSDAYADGCVMDLTPCAKNGCYNHIDFIKDKINQDNNFSKYETEDEDEVEAREALVVLTGGNKLKKHCCAGKIGHIIEKHGNANVLFKKHPVSYATPYQELQDYFGGYLTFAEGSTDLFKLMKNSKYVYTTMLSESALIANILGKKVGHIDLLQTRSLGSFTHINYYLFSTQDPVDWAKKAFLSHKSGVIHPEVDVDWKDKVDYYLEYINDLRELYKDAYIT